MINLLSLLIASGTGWAVFSPKVCDGMVTKHLLIFASILASLSTFDGNLFAAFTTAVFLLVIALLLLVKNHFQRRQLHGNH